MNAISMNNLWNYLQGLSLSASNRQWLAERLMNFSEKTAKETEKTLDGLTFPKIPKDYQVSDEVLNMACEPFPADFNVDLELDEMWEERAR
jgi:hypothetical protein